MSQPLVYGDRLSRDTVRDIRAALDKVGRDENGKMWPSWIATFAEFVHHYPEGVKPENVLELSTTEFCTQLSWDKANG